MTTEEIVGAHFGSTLFELGVKCGLAFLFLFSIESFAG